MLPLGSPLRFGPVYNSASELIASARLTAFLFILEGSGVVRVGDETEPLYTGDAALAPSGVIHSIRNPGPERLVVMAVLAPPRK